MTGQAFSTMDLTKSYRWVRSFLQAYIFASIALLVVTGLFFFADYISERPVKETWDLIIWLSSVVLYGFRMAFCGSVITICIWTYRAAVNAQTTSGRKDISPGWSVMWYFIPVANLWKPCQALKQIWTESVGRKIPSKFGWWWACWIMGVILSGIAAYYWQHAISLGQFKTTYLFAALSGVALILSAWVLCGIIRDITQAQTNKSNAEMTLLKTSRKGWVRT